MGFEQRRDVTNMNLRTQQNSTSQFKCSLALGKLVVYSRWSLYPPQNPDLAVSKPCRRYWAMRVGCRAGLLSSITEIITPVEGI